MSEFKFIVSAARLLAERDLFLRFQRGPRRFGAAALLVFPVVLIAAHGFALHHGLGVHKVGLPLFLSVGVLHWHFFSATVSRGTATLVSHQRFLQRYPAPPLVYPLSSTLLGGAELLLAVGLLLLLYPALGGSYHLLLLLYPLLWLQWVTLVFGVVLIISACHFYLRDVRELVALGLHLMFWCSPILYGARRIPADLQPLMWLFNPIVAHLDITRSVLYSAKLPNLSSWLVALAWDLLVLVAGTIFFKNYGRGFSEPR